MVRGGKLAYDVDPRPVQGRIIITRLAGNDQQHNNQNRRRTPRNDAQHDPTRALMRRDREPPHRGEELRIHQPAQHDRVRRKCQIVEAHGRVRRERMTRGVLAADGGRVEECGGVEQVAEKPDEIRRGEVDGEAARGAAAVVEDGLRVERGGPADDAGRGGKKRRRRTLQHWVLVFWIG